MKTYLIVIFLLENIEKLDSLFITLSLRPNSLLMLKCTMTKTNKTDMEAKKAAAAKRETALRGKPLEPSEPSQ
ncbi:hypothetical protein F2Q70_00015350 [Brassica cretica]|uniref:Uncharacterized protein n=1 Tax=Brassica cretica TaxID=69181 RepID=A0A8S9I1Y9_BRACR|nr:hypothetical protein F2Q70_00015350 [Brassica cretica]